MLTFLKFGVRRAEFLRLVGLLDVLNTFVHLSDFLFRRGDLRGFGYRGLLGGDYFGYTLFPLFSFARLGFFLGLLFFVVFRNRKLPSCTILPLFGFRGKNLVT